VRKDVALLVFAYSVFLSACAAGSVSSIEVRPPEHFVRTGDRSVVILHDFGDGYDGIAPEGALIEDSFGNLYGTTNGGGINGVGTIYEISESTGQETILHQFAGPDGAGPLAGPIRDAAGNLYGTTGLGGARGSLGVVYKLAPNGTETVLHKFHGGSDGAHPIGALVRDLAGNLYGTTEDGGSGSIGSGTVFQVKGYKETVLYRFSGADGSSPDGGLVRDASNNLYGTTSTGGAYGSGVVFKLSPSGNETVLYSFNGIDGLGPDEETLVLDSSGNLYGTTNGGGPADWGVVFSLSSEGKYTILHAFAAKYGGLLPWTGVVRDTRGNLYGTTAEGGVANHGALFRVSASGDEKVLIRFNGSDGSLPEAPPLLSSGNQLYGTTTQGGAYNGGVLYHVLP